MTDLAAPETGSALTHAQVMRVIYGLMLGMFLSALDSTIVSTAIPTIIEDLRGLDHYTWVFTSYMLASTVATPLWGKAGDLFSRRIMLRSSIIIFLAGSVLCGIAQSMTQLIVCRALQGIGGGGLISLAFGVMADVLTPRQRGKYMGLFSAVFAVASLIGPFIGGLFVDHLDWRWIFYINLPFGALALTVTDRALRLAPVNRREASMDLAGAATLSAGIVCLLLASVWGGDQYAWGSATIVGLFGASAVLVVVFVLIERRAPEPVLPLHFFTNRSISLSIVISLFGGVAMMGASAYLPLFLQAVRGVSATNSGLLLAPLMAGTTISSMAVGRRITATGTYKRYLIGGCALLAVGVGLLASLDASTPRGVVSVYMVVLGLGMGTSSPVTNLAAQNAVKIADLGAVSSALMFLRTMGGLLGVAAAGSVFLSHVRSGVAALPGAAGIDPETLVQGPRAVKALEEPLKSQVIDVLAHGIALGFRVAVPAVVLGLVFSFFLPEIPLRDRFEDVPDIAH